MLVKRENVFRDSAAAGAGTCAMLWGLDGRTRCNIDGQTSSGLPVEWGVCDGIPSRSTVTRLVSGPLVEVVVMALAVVVVIPPLRRYSRVLSSVPHWTSPVAVCTDLISPSIVSNVAFGSQMSELSNGSWICVSRSSSLGQLR